MAGLLAEGFAVSANLFNCRTRSFIVAHYDIIRTEALRRAEAVARYIENTETVSLKGLEDLLAVTRNEKSKGSLLALPQVGPFALTLGLIAEHRVKIATAFWAMDGEQKRLLERSGVVLLDLNRDRTPFSIIRRIGKLYDHGYIMCLLIEVPMKSRRLYSFMGYRVKCSSLIETLAKYYKLEVSGLYCLLSDTGEIQIVVSNAFRSNELTQRLLSWSEAVAVANIEQYDWSEASIVFSDPSAFANGLTFLPEIVSWRDRVVSRMETRPRG
jgi:lauroyl/myristoyl acyltransferase